MRRFNKFGLSCLALTLIEPGSGRTIKYRSLLNFDLAFIRSKPNSPSICVVYHSALRFRESAQNCAAPAILLERAREPARLRTHQPLHSHSPVPETDQNPDWCCTGLRIADHSPTGLLWPSGGLSSKTVQKGRGQQGRVSPLQDF